MIYLHEYATCKFCAFCHLPIEKSLPCKVCTNDYHEECFDSHGCKSCKNCENGKCLSTMVLKGRNKIKVFKEEDDVTCNLNLLNIFANSENLENAYSIVKKMKESDIDSIVKKMTNYKGTFLHEEVKNKGCINKIVTYYTREQTFTYFWKKIYYVNNCKICNSNFHTSNKAMRICKECNACHSCGSMADDCDSMFYMPKHIGQPTLRKLLYCKDCYHSYVLKDEICPICAKAYTQEEMLECDWCLRWIHYDCELNKDIIKAIDNDAFQDLYKCQVCIVFENYWLGKKAENVKTVLEPIAGEKKLAAKAIITKGCKKPECYICVRAFNDEESKIIRLVKVMCGDTTKYAHNICALSHITSIVENRIMIDAKKMKCKRCHKPNATFKCVICKDDYYHFDCAFSDKNDLFRSNYLIPICETHLRRDIGIVNKLTKLYDTSEFFEIKKTKPSTIRINNYNINSDGSFDIIIYLEQKTILLRCDFKNFYFDGAVSYQDEIVSKLQSMKTNVNFTDAISNGIHLYNLHCKALNAPYFGNDRYNKCINSKFQQANYTSSHISSALSQKLSLYKEKSKIHGFGIFADRFYAPGDIIIAYEGCIINKQRANELEKEYSHLDHYLFKTNDKIIDATYMGNLAKYINQSCNPNCFSTQATWDNKKGILICAKKYITSGEEITYKYGFNGGKMQCNCNAYGCKKTLN